VSFQFGVSDGAATIEHAGGDSFSAGEMLVVAGDTEQSWASLSGEDGPVERAIRFRSTLRAARLSNSSTWVATDANSSVG